MSPRSVSRGLFSLLAGTLLVALSVPATAQTPAQSQAEIALGERLYSDNRLSRNFTHSCATCHSLNPSVHSIFQTSAPTFTDNAAILVGSPVSLGTTLAAGSLNAQTVSYSAFNPFFGGNSSSGYVGGQFWNGRANTLQVQASRPFFNDVEMDMDSIWQLMSRIRGDAQLQDLFDRAYGIDLGSLPANLNARNDDNTPQSVLNAFQGVTRSIARFESTQLFNSFTSKADFVAAGQASFTAAEQRGWELFTGRAGCSSCHTADWFQTNTGEWLPPLLTDHRFYNIGAPRNLNIAGWPTPNIGLAGNPEVIADGAAAREFGKHKTPSLRNVAFSEKYLHNGVLNTVRQVVHFKNTRDTLWRGGNNWSWGFGIWIWPAPEYSQNLNYQMGSLGLSDRDEADIVAFLETLTDRWQGRETSPWTAVAERHLYNKFLQDHGDY